MEDEDEAAGDVDVDDDPDDEDDDPPAAGDGYRTAQTSAEMAKALRESFAGRNQNYAVALDPAEGTATATFAAPDITATGGGLATIGKLMVALQRFLASIRADTDLTGLVFANSVTFTLTPRVSSVEQTRINELREAVPNQEDVGAEDVAYVVPSSIIRLEAAARILNEPASQVASRVRVLSAGATEELRKLADALDKAEATLTFSSPTETRATLGERKAKQYAASLKERERVTTEVYEVVGVLSRTDSEAEEFRLRVDRDLLPADLFHARRQHIEGGYTDEASDAVRELGLWDRRVIASVEARIEEPPGGGRPRPTTFTFLNVRAAAE
jgi:hypothetical protein